MTTSPLPADGLEPLFALIAARTGTALSRQQRERLAQALLARLGDKGPLDLLAFLESRGGAHVLAELLAVISVHKTDLFRDEVQLEALKKNVLQPMALTGRPLLVWSAGCSTGEEVATLLILLAQAGANPGSRLLGTDISDAALAEAKRLAFAPEVMRRVPLEVKNRYFEEREVAWRLVGELTAQARFQRHNLMDTPYPLPEGRGTFDVVVCRNVLIYFTEQATEQTVTRLAERLRPGGVLVLSAAEPILKQRVDLETVRYGNVFFYRKVDPLEVKPVPPPARPSAPRPSAPFARASTPRPLASAPRASAPAPAPRPSGPAAPTPSSPRPSVPRTWSGEIPAAPQTPEEEGRRLFELVMDWAAAGENEADTEAGLRKALYLAPELAAARYLLGLLLERRGEKADAASEYRRAVLLLDEGQATPSGFFLNNERLAAACAIALKRLGYPARR